MTLRMLTFAAPAALLLATAPAAAAQPAAPTASMFASAAVPTAPGVAAFYQRRGNAPIWLRDASTAQAAMQLVGILRNSDLDGFSLGPQLAGAVEAAVRQGSGASGNQLLQSELLISTAWVLYVHALQTPGGEMIYRDPSLQPRPSPAGWILQQAINAPLLSRHVQQVAAVNPLYAQLRAAALAQRAAGTAPDQRLLVNLERTRALPPTGKFVVVDVATARLSMYEDGRVVDQMKVVVGKPDLQTPLFASTINYVTFNPYWNVPDDLVSRKTAPTVLRQGASYLKSRNYEVFSGWEGDVKVLPPGEVDWKAVAEGREIVRVRQLPGPTNAMGKMKFYLQNGAGIYLHDTPERNLFLKAQRTLSSGCIRLEDAARFGRWLLGSEPVAPSSEPEAHVQLAKGVPVYITYLTAHPHGDQLTFSDDIYGLDARSATRLASRP